MMNMVPMPTKENPQMKSFQSSGNTWRGNQADQKSLKAVADKPSKLNSSQKFSNALVNNDANFVAVSKTDQSIIPP